MPRRQRKQSVQLVHVRGLEYDDRITIIGIMLKHNIRLGQLDGFPRQFNFRL
jgi:hypothetical protein